MNKIVKLVLVIISLSIIGSAIYFLKFNKESEVKVEDKINVVNSQNEIEKNNLKEYKNLEAGFTFKYPKEYGEILIQKESPDDIGYSIKGSTASQGKSFWFNYSTKDFVVGDYSAEDNTNYNPCEDTEMYSSCQTVLSKDGTEIKLLTKRNPGQSESYSLVIPKLKNTNFIGLVFISSSRTLLINIASQFELI